jgi:hypothetical protein
MVDWLLFVIHERVQSMNFTDPQFLLGLVFGVVIGLVLGFAGAAALFGSRTRPEITTPSRPLPQSQPEAARILEVPATQHPTGSIHSAFVADYGLEGRVGWVIFEGSFQKYYFAADRKEYEQLVQEAKETHRKLGFTHNSQGTIYPRNVLP